MSDRDFNQKDDSLKRFDEDLSLDELKELIGDVPAADADLDADRDNVLEEALNESNSKSKSKSFDAESGAGSNDEAVVFITGKIQDDDAGATQSLEKQRKKVEKIQKKIEKEDKKALKIARRQRTGCLGGLVYFLFIVCISSLLAVIGWMAATDVLGLGKEELTAVIEVENNDDVKAVAEKLEEAGIIEYPWLFRLFGVLASADDKIVAGSFEVTTAMDYRALISAMGQNAATRLTVKIVIPEGYTVEQILQTLADNGVADINDLKNTAANYDFEYSFLQNIPLGAENRLEGYLFPDTYDFYINENTITAINKMLANFNNRFTSEMRDRAAEMGYSMHDIVIIASMIEREAASNDERATISSVIYNRLNSPNFTCIQIDATVQYALPERKEELSYEDLEIDSPYNTYLYPGLPAGPISCPGWSSLNAALYPEDTNYYFYALDTDGTHHFTSTIEEHDAFVNSVKNSQAE